MQEISYLYISHILGTLKYFIFFRLKVNVLLYLKIKMIMYQTMYILKHFVNNIYSF